MIEKTKSEIAPEINFLAQLESFLGQTAAITAEQIRWLDLSEPLITSELYETHEREIKQAVDDNISAAGSFVSALAWEGIRICARNAEGLQLPLLGLSYDTDCGHYWAGVKAPDGPIQWPLDGTSELVVNR